MSREAVVAVTDLLLQSRVVEQARLLGFGTTIANDAGELTEALRGRPVDLVVLDLHADGIGVGDVVAAAKEAREGPAPILAFGRHTAPALLRAARDAGCDLVVPRSKLVGELPALIERLAGPAMRRPGHERQAEGP